MSGRSLVPVVSARGLYKAYPGVVALQGADLEVLPGEIVGLVGKNGAGKSTVIGILAGAVKPDLGEIQVDGRPVPSSYTPPVAHRLGLAFMHQELGNFREMSVAENVAIGASFPTRAGGLIRWRRLNRSVREVLRDVAADLDPLALVGELSSVNQRLVMIARALYHDAKLLVLDEPSASLTSEEIDNLIRILFELRDRGRSVLYVSHRLSEILRITDRVTVMQDGLVTLSRATSGMTYDDIVAAVIGGPAPTAADIGRPTESGPAPPTLSTPVGPHGVKPPRLRVRGLAREGAVAGVSFDLSDGEILGIAGLVGSGRTELVRLLAGADKADEGTIEINGSVVRFRSPHSAIGAGIALLPEDRRHEGLVMVMNLRENVTLPSLSDHARRLRLISKSSERRRVRALISSLSIRATGPEQPVATLSGGNQQKVVLAKWLSRSTDVLIFDEPTQGVDIHAKEEIFAEIRSVASHGKAVIVISSDFAELVALCNRVIVLREGHLTGELLAPMVSEEAITRLAYAEYTA